MFRPCVPFGFAVVGAHITEPFFFFFSISVASLGRGAALPQMLVRVELEQY